MELDQIKKKLLEKFFEVSRERLQKMNSYILSLEKTPEDAYTIKELMREIHTLKGESRMMEFARVGNLSHSLEDLLKALNEKGFKMRKTSVDIILKAMDTISYLITNGDEGVDIESLTSTLSKECQGIKMRSASDADETKEVPSTASPEGKPVMFDKKDVVRVKADKLDSLSASLGDSLISHGGSEHLIEELRDAMGLFDVSSASARERVSFILGRLREKSLEMERHLKLLDEQLSEIRLFSFSIVFAPFQRMVRDMARDAGKEITIIITGENTLADRRILQEIQDPLIHLIKNSIEHGIETPEERMKAGKPVQGRIMLSASQKGDKITVEVEDDGKGIDPAKIKEVAIKKGIITQGEADTLSDQDAVRLIFRYGFTTKEHATEFAGRGIGMDVVEERMRGIGGNVEISSNVGKGTRVIMSFPYTISVISVLLFQAGDQTFALPTYAVEEMRKSSAKEIHKIEGKEVIFVRETSVPLVPMANVLKLNKSGNGGKRPVLIIKHGEDMIGWEVESVIGEREVVIKPIEDYLKAAEMYAGATILEDGRVVLILHPSSLYSAGREFFSGKRPVLVSEPIPTVDRKRKRTILLVEDSLVSREVERGILEGAGYDVDEASDGLEALKILEKKSFDLVVTDISMPNLDGFELTKRIKNTQAWKNIPIVVVTTLGSEEDKRRGMDAGADAYFLKSGFKKDELIDTIRRLIH